LRERFGQFLMLHNLKVVLCDWGRVRKSNVCLVLFKIVSQILNKLHGIAIIRLFFRKFVAHLLQVFNFVIGLSQFMIHRIILLVRYFKVLGACDVVKILFSSQSARLHETSKLVWTLLPLVVLLQRLHVFVLWAHVCRVCVKLQYIHTFFMFAVIAIVVSRRCRRGHISGAQKTCRVVFEQVRVPPHV